VKRIVIIGGGISGLATAHRLLELARERKQTLQITLVEASRRLGGTLQTLYRDGFLLERGPDSFISEKPEAVSLAKRLGLDSRLIETNQQHRRSFIVRDGRLRPVPEGFQLVAPSRIGPFIASDIFSWAGKLRMAADLFLPRGKTTGTNDESLASFVRRRLGNEALERMAQPMVGGIYTADAETLSLRATLPRFLDMERKHRSLILAMFRQAKTERKRAGVSGPRYSLFLSFDRGMRVLIEALEKAISNPDQSKLSNADFPEPEIQVLTRVTGVERTKNHKWRIHIEDSPAIEGDAVCLALHSHLASSLLNDAAPQLSAKLDRIKFASTVTVNLGFRRQDVHHKLDGFGFVVPFVEKRSVLACSFSSVKFSGRAPDEHVLLRAFVGGAMQAELLDLAEDEMLRRVLQDLRQLLGITAEPLFVETAKWRNSMPQYQVGHLDLINEIDSELAKVPGVALAGNSYRGAGIPDCIRSGENAAKKMFEYVGMPQGD
jgi:protoporphyrinogen/coproporphyrinogen III oxidase